jgi:hypothetical protein
LASGMLAFGQVRRRKGEAGSWNVKLGPMAKLRLNLLFILCIGLSSFVCVLQRTKFCSTPPPARDFSMVVSPATITAAAVSSNSTFAVSITGQNGFSSAAVTLSGLRAGTTTSPASPFSCGRRE